MKNIVAFGALTALALAATPAAAQVAAPSGPRVEALVGYDKTKVDFSDTGYDYRMKSDGALYGVGAGYDFGLANGASLGVDVEATGSTAKEEIGTAEIKTGRDLYAGGRVSFGVSPNTTAYLKAGYTNARFKVTDDTLGVSEADNLNGYRLGAGAQVGLGGNAFVGGEYRYSDYENDVSRHQLVAKVGTRF